jgi:ribosome-binding protein aMBF1 (putative translation factor)
MLRAARERAGYTREALANELTRTADVIRYYEAGRVHPPHNVRVRLAHLLDEPGLLEARVNEAKP